MKIRTVLALAASSFLVASSAFAQVAPGSRVKLPCPAMAPPDHPCRAVYYVGGDGRRRAFPNASVYSTWFADFVGVETIDAATMAALPLGPNVTFRPGSRLVKIPSDPKVYAIDATGVLRWVSSETVAKGLYGADWNKKVSDLPEAFVTDYRYGSYIYYVTDYDAASRLAAAPTIDGDGATYESKKVTTAHGVYDVQVVTLARSRFRMKTPVAAEADCGDGCATKSLADYAKGAFAGMGIHGTYFCPPDYPSCLGKTNSFLWPVFDSTTREMRNAGAIPLHNGPMIAESADGQVKYYHRAGTLGSANAFEQATGSPLDAAVANYPSLVENGARVVDAEPMLEDAQKTTKGVRGGIGLNDDAFLLVLAKSATVPDLADIMIALGAKDAMNLDGGGSAALMYAGAYKAGPGRALPNAIVFVRK